MSGLYIHIPFCKSKCLYCDFYTGGARIADWKVYVDCLLNELYHRKEGCIKIPDTLYIGGGTPSLIPGNDFQRLITGIKKIFKVSDWEEATIEVNPEDVSSEKIEIWKDSGINRISLGVQSLNDQELSIIGRKHKGETAIKAITKLLEEFKNVSVDIMFGLPGQTLESYISTMEKIIEIRPPHISSYSLMLEEGTAMTLLSRQGKLNLPEEEIWIQMSDYTSEKLKDSGYYRYEISNYSLPGFESKHNNSYWEGKPYLGIGPGAHSYNGNKKRYANPTNIKEYIKFYKNEGNWRNNSNFYKEEILSNDELIEEAIFTRLRTSRGIDLKEFENRFGNLQKETLLKKAYKYINSGFLKEGDGFLAFTTKGFQISDSLLLSLI